MLNFSDPHYDCPEEEEAEEEEDCSFVFETVSQSAKTDVNRDRNPKDIAKKTTEASGNLFQRRSPQEQTVAAAPTKTNTIRITNLSDEGKPHHPAP